MYNITLLQLRTTILQRCHMENSQVCTTAELNQYINDSGSELNDQLAAAFGAKYNMKVQTFKTNASTDTYPIPLTWTYAAASSPFAVNNSISGNTSGATAIIRSLIGINTAGFAGLSDVTGTFTAGETITGPNGTAVLGSSNGGIGAADFMQLQGMDIQIAGNRWLPIREFKMSERGYFQLPGYNMNVLGPIFAYRFQGNNIVLAPQPQGTYTMRLFYTPTWTQLVADIDAVDAVDGWHELIIVDGCIKVLVKQDLPADAFMMQKQAMLKRMEDLKQQRDASVAPRIADTSSDAMNDWINTYGRTFGV